jgi:DNA-directed RNA polymerase specialized sigma24 family protein
MLDLSSSSGESCAPSGAFPDFDRAGYNDAIDIVRKAVPSWARQHDDFSGAADEAIVEALRSYKPDKGMSFRSFLALRASSRVPTLLARQDRHVEHETHYADVPTEEFGAAERRAAEAVTGEGEIADAITVLTEYIDSQVGRKQEIAAIIAMGHTAAEAAVLLDVSPAYISKILKSLRPSAASHFTQVSTTAVPAAM